MTWTRQRKLLAAVAAVCIVAFAWFSYEVLTVFYQETNPAVDSRAALRSLALDGAGLTAEQGDAAWSLLVEIFDAVDEVDAEVNAMCDAGEFEERDEYLLEVDYSRVLEGRTVPQRIEPERRAMTLLHDRGVFDKLRRFSGGPPGLRPITGAGPLGIHDVLDDLSRARNLAQLNASAMRLAAVEGDFADVAALFEQMLALARTMAWQPYLISYLTAIAIEALAFEELKHELMERAFDEASCRALLESLDRHAGLPGVVFPLEAERVFAHDWLQWSYSDDGEGDGYLVSAPMPGSVEKSDRSLVGAVIARFFYQTRAQAAAALDDHFDRLVTASQMSVVAQATALAELEGGLDSLIPLRPYQVMRTAGTRMVVIIALHRALHGAYPASLDAVEGDVPVDPLHHLPFGYTLLDDDPHGRGYLLYSVGLDATDNAGIELDPDIREALGWHAALNDLDAAGSDFVLNRPRPVPEDSVTSSSPAAAGSR